MTDAEIATIYPGDRVRIFDHEVAVEWLVGTHIGGVRDDGKRFSTARPESVTLISRKPRPKREAGK